MEGKGFIIYGFKFVKKDNCYWLIDGNFYGSKGKNFAKYIPSKHLFKFKTIKQAEKFLRDEGIFKVK